MKFGRVQMRIMQILWEKGQATSREITRALNEYEPSETMGCFRRLLSLHMHEFSCRGGMGGRRG